MRCRGAQEDPQKRAVCLLSHYEKGRVTVKPKSSQDPAGPQVAGPLLSSLLCSLSSESCRVSSVPLTFHTCSNLRAFALAALHWLLPLPGMLFPQIPTWLLLPSSLSPCVTFSVRLSLGPFLHCLHPSFIFRVLVLFVHSWISTPTRVTST